jgi:hypothetical protein
MQGVWEERCWVGYCMQVSSMGSCRNYRLHALMCGFMHRVCMHCCSSCPASSKPQARQLHSPCKGLTTTRAPLPTRPLLIKAPVQLTCSSTAASCSLP